MLSLPVVRTNDIPSLRLFSSELHGAVAALSYSGHQHELASSGTLKQLVLKILSNLREKWGLQVYDMQSNAPSITDLDNWLRRFSKSSEFSMTSSQAPKKSSKGNSFKGGYKKPTSHHQVNTTLTLQSEDEQDESPKSEEHKGTRSAYKCLTCEVSPPHRITNCPVFAELTPTERVVLIRKENRCLRCITGRHRSKNCERNEKCGVEKCSQHHHHLLHGAEGLHVSFDESEKATVAVGVIQPHQPTPPVLHQVAPVTIYSEHGKVETYAFLDRGSDATFVTSRIAKELGLKGPRTKLCFGIFLGNGTDMATSIVSFRIGPLGQPPAVDIKRAYTVSTLNLPSPHLDWTDLKSRWEHMANMTLPTIGSRKIEFLIGIDVPEVHGQLEVRRPDYQETGPVAIRTTLGWNIVGPTGSQPERTRNVNISFTQERDESYLEESLERLWSTEAFGINLQDRTLSADEERGLNTFRRTIVCNERRYVVGLMWRNPNPILPNNRSMAIRRLYSLKKHFRRDHHFAQRYEAVINEYIALGHARQVTQEEIESSPLWTWHMPHHGVINPNKPDKIRVVFDASAEFEGMSLNKALYKGPDLLTSLLGVLLRFRFNPVTLISDIEKMYHQVLVRPEDQPALRFVWRYPGSTTEVTTYQMMVHVFGVVTSPTTSLFALLKTAEDNQEAYPDGERLLRRLFYVDNYLDSVDTVQEAIHNTEQLTKLLTLGGFRLTK